MRKRELSRPFPPDYVSAETLAYRLDCAPSTIADYVRLGLLPKPETVGNLVRWDFDMVRASIKAQNNVSDDGSSADPYLRGAQRVQASQS